MLLAAFLACAAEAPPPVEPAAPGVDPVATIPGEVATPVPAGPPPETQAAAIAIHESAVAADAELAGRSRRKVTRAPCAATLDPTIPALWVTGDRPAEAPGVRAAAELLHAVNPASYPAVTEAGAEPQNATVGVAAPDVERVRTALSSTRVFYWEAEGTPPVLDESATPPPGERVFTGGRSAGEAWVWDGAARRLVCRAAVTVENTSPIATKATEKVGWDIGLAVSVAAAQSATAVE